MKKGVPFIVKIRAFLFHAIIACIALVVNVLLSLFFMADAVGACADIKRIDDSPHSEIVFAGARNGDVSFYYLRQQHLVGEKFTAVSCDILMTEEGASYPETPVYFSDGLEKGTCAVSKNLAKRYGLNIGDVAHIAGTEITFKVARFLPAQSGLDEEYKREGVAVLAYDGALLDKTYSFMSFMTDGDAYSALDRLVYIDDLRAGNVTKLAVGASVFAVAFAFTLTLCEVFLFARRRADYRIYSGLGRGRMKAFFAIFGENALKYIAPLALCTLIFLSDLACYGAIYLIPVLFTLAISFVAVTGFSAVLTWRIYECRVKMKKSFR